MFRMPSPRDSSPISILGMLPRFWGEGERPACLCFLVRRFARVDAEKHAQARNPVNQFATTSDAPCGSMHCAPKPAYAASEAPPEQHCRKQRRAYERCAARCRRDGPARARLLRARREQRVTRERERADQAGVLAVRGRDNVAVDVLREELLALQVAVEQLSATRPNLGVKALTRHHAAAKHDALDGDEEREVGAERGDVVRGEVPHRVRVGHATQLRLAHAGATGERGRAHPRLDAARDAQVKRALPRVARRVGDEAVAPLRMEHAVNGEAVHHEPDTDPRPNRDVRARRERRIRRGGRAVL
mmetsp:Transcript_16201/g.50471  ORF Transcript_16201/g.50471 Transcript_16201/m.50471 type:complete len:303 (+) Transcript_16201:1756-2664(+)